MRIRFSLFLAVALATAFPAFGSTVTPARVVHHRRGHFRHPAVSRRARMKTAALETGSAERHTRIAPVARVRFVPPLRGSLASLVRQNERDTAEGLERIANDAELDQLESVGDLQILPVSASLRVNPDLPENRRYCRPWTARFLADLSRAHYARFHRPLQVNSAVRTVAFQRALMTINGNAAPAEGDIASPHLTGAAVDIGKRGLSFQEIAWMRGWLLPLQTAGKIDVEEEFYQSCFHITVYRGYTPPVEPRFVTTRMVARRRHAPGATMLAARIR